MFSPSRKKRKTGAKLCDDQGECCAAEMGVEPERVHRGAVADACVDSGNALDMRVLLYSLNGLLEERPRDIVTANLEPERPLAVSRASSVEESDRDEDKLMVDRKSSEEELETIEDKQDVAECIVGPASASGSFFYRGQSQSVYARSFEALPSSYDSQLLSSKVTDSIANPPQNN